MERTPTITCVGDDEQTTFKFYVLCDPDLSSEHIGWVLVVDGPDPLYPQYVTPTEVTGDLRSMGIEDDGIHYLVRAGTEDMLKQLRSRSDAGQANSATAARIAELEHELTQLPEFDVD